MGKGGGVTGADGKGGMGKGGGMTGADGKGSLGAQTPAAVDPPTWRKGEKRQQQQQRKKVEAAQAKA
jgi:hypothetical protein